MLQEIGLTRFDLDDGSVVTVKPTYGGYIKHDNKEEAHKWLKDHGHDDLIKNQITVAFGRGEDAKASEFWNLQRKRVMHLLRAKRSIPRR